MQNIQNFRLCQCLIKIKYTRILYLHIIIIIIIRQQVKQEIDIIILLSTHVSDTKTSCLKVKI